MSPMADHTLAERVLHLRAVYDAANDWPLLVIADHCGFSGPYTAELLGLLKRELLVWEQHCRPRD